MHCFAVGVQPPPPVPAVATLPPVPPLPPLAPVPPVPPVPPFPPWPPTPLVLPAAPPWPAPPSATGVDRGVVHPIPATATSATVAASARSGRPSIATVPGRSNRARIDTPI